MKHRDFKNCVFCGRGVMHAGNVSFFRLRIERFVVDVREVNRAHGMEQMMGGHALLANIMGPDRDLAQRLGDAHDVLLCEPCSLNPNESPFFSLYEAAGREVEKRAEALRDATAISGEA